MHLFAIARPQHTCNSDLFSTVHDSRGPPHSQQEVLSYLRGKCAGSTWRQSQSSTVASLICSMGTACSRQTPMYLLMQLQLAVCGAAHTCRACCTSCHRKLSANRVSHRSESWLVSSSLSQLLLTCGCVGPTNRSSCCTTTQRLAPVAVPMLWPQQIYLQSLTRTLFVAGGEFYCTVLFGRSMRSRGGCCTSFAHPIAPGRNDIQNGSL